MAPDEIVERLASVFGNVEIDETTIVHCCGEMLNQMLGGRAGVFEWDAGGEPLQAVTDRC